MFGFSPEFDLFSLHQLKTNRWRECSSTHLNARNGSKAAMTGNGRKRSLGRIRISLADLSNTFLSIENSFAASPIIQFDRLIAGAANKVTVSLKPPDAP